MITITKFSCMGMAVLTLGIAFYFYEAIYPLEYSTPLPTAYINGATPSALPSGIPQW